MNREQQICFDVIDVFKELADYAVDFWLMSGSALGATLTGGILKDDRDIDIGIKKRRQGEAFDSSTDSKNERF